MTPLQFQTTLSLMENPNSLSSIPLLYQNKHRRQQTPKSWHRRSSLHHRLAKQLIKQSFIGAPVLVPDDWDLVNKGGLKHKSKKKQLEHSDIARPAEPTPDLKQEDRQRWTKSAKHYGFLLNYSPDLGSENRLTPKIPSVAAPKVFSPSPSDLQPCLASALNSTGLHRRSSTSPCSDIWRMSRLDTAFISLSPPSLWTAKKEPAERSSVATRPPPISYSSAAPASLCKFDTPLRLQNFLNRVNPILELFLLLYQLPYLMCLLISAQLPIDKICMLERQKYIKPYLLVWSFCFSGLGFVSLISASQQQLKTISDNNSSHISSMGYEPGLYGLYTQTNTFALNGTHACMILPRNKTNIFALNGTLACMILPRNKTMGNMSLYAVMSCIIIRLWPGWKKFDLQSLPNNLITKVSDFSSSYPSNLLPLISEGGSRVVPQSEAVVPPSRI